MLVSEVAIVRMLEHGNVARCIETVESRTHMYIVMEHVPGGNLYSLLQKRKYFSEFWACYVVYHILLALSYLHSLGIVHRDVKPENVLLLLSEKQDQIVSLKLIDFGLSCLCLSTCSVREACGTPAYVAPEVVRHKSYGAPADLWSLGVILYLLYLNMTVLCW